MIVARAVDAVVAVVVKMIGRARRRTGIGQADAADVFEAAFDIERGAVTEADRALHRRRGHLHRHRRGLAHDGQSSERIKHKNTSLSQDIHMIDRPQASDASDDPDKPRRLLSKGKWLDEKNVRLFDDTRGSPVL